MKKIGIKTWTGGTNYGTNLQAYALKRYLEIKGYEANIIGVVCHNINYLLHPDMFLEKIKERKVRRSISTRKETASKKSVRYAQQLIEQKKKFDSFCGSEFPKVNARGRKQWKKIAETYFAFVTGSDQVWNPSFFEPQYMLDFVQEKNIKKVSYAASLGVTALDNKTLRKYKRYLNSYSAISVREESAEELLQPICQVNVKTVLDPTMLLSFDEWKCFSDDAEVSERWNVKLPYILCYFVGEKEEYWQFVDKIRIITGFNVLVIPMGENSFKEEYDLLFDVGPREFVWLIRNASIVCTDSFHASVFSILSHREFYVLKRFSDNEKTSQNTRLYHLLSCCDITDRMVNSDYLSFSRIPDIDYDKVDCNLEKQRAESRKFLDNALCD